MSELLERLKNYYKAAMENNIQWYDYFPNNMPQNGKRGIYTYFWFKKEDKWEFIKFTIAYQSPVDAKGLSHPEEGVKYYILHQYRETYNNILTIPQPSKKFDYRGDTETCFSPNIVNSFGRFRHVFDDEETAKAVISTELLHILYPYLYILDKESLSQWNEFVEAYN